MLRSRARQGKTPARHQVPRRDVRFARDPAWSCTQGASAAARRALDENALRRERLAAIGVWVGNRAGGVVPSSGFKTVSVFPMWRL
jgi:hypothetical protein